MKRNFLYSFLCLAVLGIVMVFDIPAVHAAYGDVSTFVGKIYDGDGGTRVNAYFDFPEDVDIDSTGNFFIADTYDNVIRKIDSSGIVSTLAGTGSYGDTEGPTSSAEFALPRGVAVDADGTVYVADTANNKIKKISGSTVTTLVASGLSGPEGVKVYGTTVYIVDTGNNAIKTVSTAGGAVSTLTSSLNKPKKIAINSDGSLLYVADAGSYRVLSVNTATGTVNAVAGSGVAGYAEGSGTTAQFRNIWGVALDGSWLYVSDGNGITDLIRKIDLSANTTSLFAEDSGMASINYPAGLKVYNGNVYVANSGIGTIHRFSTASSSDEEIYAGYERFGNRNGLASQALFGRPYDLVMSADRQYLYVADNNKIRRVTRSTGETAQVIGSSVDYYREGDDNPNHGSGPVRFSTIQGLAINSTGTRLYVADRWNNRIRGVNLEKSPAESYLISGAGYRGVDMSVSGATANAYQEGTKCSEEFNLNVSGCSYFNGPAGIAIDPDNVYLYVTDTGNNRIRRVKISTGETTLIAGSGEAGFADGTGSTAKFNRPFGITIDASGSNIYVADSNNHAIRQINLTTKAVTTLVGTGSAGYREAIGRQAVLSYPEYIKMGSDGLLYFSDAGSQRLRLVDTATALTKLVAGNGNRGFLNGKSTAAEFNNPKGLAPDVTGKSLYVTDTWNDVIRKIDITGTAPYTNPAPRVSSVSPKEVNPAWDKGAGLQVTVSGSNFTFGAKTYFADYLSEKTYVQTASALAVKLPLSKLKPGWYDVTVINLDGQRATLEHAIGITDSKGTTPATYYEYSQKTPETITNTTVPAIKTASGDTFLAYLKTIRGGFVTAAANLIGDANDEIVTAPADAMAPQVRVFDSAGKVLSQFFAYGSSTRHGVRMGICDVNGDGQPEIITTPGKGGRPQVKIFNAYGKEVNPSFYALDGKFLGGTNVTCGDTDGDGVSEIIIAAGQGGGAQVMVYNLSGKATANFFAYAKTFRGGIKVATADIDGDGKDEIITGPEVGAPHIQIFKIKTKAIVRLSPGFYAFSSSYRGGVSIAGVDTNGDGKKEIVVGTGSNATPLVKVYSAKEKLIKQFYVFATTFLGGVNVAGGDMDGDGADELIVTPRSNGGPQVKIINVDEI